MRGISISSDPKTFGICRQFRSWILRKTQRALHEGLCKGNEFIFFPCNGVISGIPSLGCVWQWFETGDLSKQERFSTEEKALGVRLGGSVDQ